MATPAPEWRHLARHGAGALRGPATPPKLGDLEPGALSTDAGEGTARRSVAATTGRDPGNSILPPSTGKRSGRRGRKEKLKVKFERTQLYGYCMIHTNTDA
ncbi:hypothetical protein NDU88_001974 [Pleurodeles waltl]|uniref:Uncharacterized protein n=1 Tax=Pleurodeles waltl TaxID=8319 RepID=A0AAV7MN12_PLEWA|nr:hypothetical protein NDU88_001974 [Pleurodeles waltl]